jgi:hypothetical protein
MVYHFLILSGEDEEFVREILIDSESTFLDFHKAIQTSVFFDQSQLASFFLSDAEWSKQQEVSLLKMDESSDALLMEDVKLSEYIENPKDKLIYTFDFFGNRGFFVELLDVSAERELKEVACVRSEGESPQQLMLDDDLPNEDSSEFDFDDDDFDLPDGIEEVSLEDGLGEDEW